MAFVPGNALRFKRALLKWYRGNGRDLPWRATRDPYRIAVSEFMLQQTQVTRVLEYYPRFLRRFPTLDALARSSPRAVREAWEGLGYYRRAENLHRLARVVVREHGGTIPGEPADLERLPGVGRYTAGAIAAFAYERRAAAVDTNVKRVLRRVFSAADRRTDGATDRTIWELAGQLLPRSKTVAWEFNQALMDLGARICVARRPRCPECPVRAACRTGSRPSPGGGP
jgi:A/G-specific adenine glycosylase